MYRTQKLRTQRHSHLIPAVLYFLAGAASWAYQEHQPVLLFLAACGFWAACAVTTWAWMIGLAVEYKIALDSAQPISEQARIMEAIARMTDTQAWLAAWYSGYDQVEQVQPPEPVIQTGVGEVEKSFAISKLDKAVRNDGYLEPVRSTSDGTPDRRRMELLTSWLISQGLAQPAAGPKPARILDYPAARRKITE